MAQLPPASWKVFEGAEETAAWERLRAAYAAMGPIVVRVIGKPTDVQGIIEAYGPSSWIAHAMNGIVLMAVGDAQSSRSDPARNSPRSSSEHRGRFGDGSGRLACAALQSV